MTLPEPSQIELSEVALAFVGAGNSDRTMRFSALVSALRQAVVGDEPELAAAALRQAVVPTLDYTTAQALVRLRRTLTGRVRARHKLRIAILGSFTTTQLVALLDLFLFAAGVEAEFYESDFGVFRQEIIDPTSTLYAFRPEILLIATTRRDLGRRPDPGIDAVTEARLLEVELGEWTALWKVAQRTAGCQVIQNNFVIPAARSLANREPAHVGRER